MGMGMGMGIWMGMGMYHDNMGEGNFGMGIEETIKWKGENGGKTFNSTQFNSIFISLHQNVEHANLSRLRGQSV